MRTYSLPYQALSLSLSLSLSQQGNKSDESLLSLKPHSDLAILHNQFNNTSPEKNNDPTNVVNLLKSTNKVFDIIAVTETRITEQTSLTTNINLRNYATEFTPTESSAGGTLLYIASHLSYKPRPDLNIYKSNQL